MSGDARCLARLVRASGQRLARHRSSPQTPLRAGTDPHFGEGSHLTALSYLVSEPSVLVANWEDEPFVSTALPDLGPVFSLATIEQLICSGTLPLPCVRLFRDGAVIATDRLGRG